MTKDEKAAYDRAYRAQNKERIAQTKRAYALANHEQEQARVKAWVEANRDRSREIKDAWKARNPTEKSPRQLLSKKDKAQRAVARVERWREANPEKYAAQRARRPKHVRSPAQKIRHRVVQSARHGRIRSATPAWADIIAIEAVYAEAKRLGLHVDHFYPLKGALVSGLHVANNLRVLAPIDNLRKGNKLPTES